MRRSADPRLKQPKDFGDQPRLKQPKALGDQPLPVRYYPRRVRSGRSRQALTPSQALHLASDPHRAALAARTAERHELVLPAPASGGRFRTWFTRLVQRSSRAR